MDNIITQSVMTGERVRETDTHKLHAHLYIRIFTLDNKEHPSSALRLTFKGECSQAYICAYVQKTTKITDHGKL